MTPTDRRAVLRKLDGVTGDIPFTHTRACHLLFDLVSEFSRPQVVEVSCCYGKATVYLAAAAKLNAGFVRAVDEGTYTWGGRNVEELLREFELSDSCEVVLNQDARWYLLDLFLARPGCWIDVAYLDASHTVEVDAFLALALWTHLRPGGIIVFDDLEWVPAVNGQPDQVFSRPTTSHVGVLYDYVRSLPDVDGALEWGKSEVAWTYGMVRKRESGEHSGVAITDLFATVAAKSIEAP